DAAARPRLAAECRYLVDRIQQTTVRRRAHAVAVQIVHFGTGPADLRQRPITHGHSEHRNAAAPRHGGTAGAGATARRARTARTRARGASTWSAAARATPGEAASRPSP